VCLTECDLEKSTVKRPRSDLVCCTAEKYIIYVCNQTRLLQIVYCKVSVCIDNQMVDTLRFGIHMPMFRILLSPSPKIDIVVFPDVSIHLNKITPRPTPCSSLAVPLKAQVT
jgi:hypothetical protein